MRISDWSSDVCSSDLEAHPAFGKQALAVNDAVMAQKLPELRIIARGRVHDRAADHRALGIELGGQAGHAERFDPAAGAEVAHRIAPRIGARRRGQRLGEDVGQDDAEWTTVAWGKSG